MAGTFDPAFERNQILVELLRRGGHDVDQRPVPLWGSQRDTMVAGGKIALLGRALAAYPRLGWQFLRARKPDVVLVAYPGHLDMLVVGLLARLRRVPVVFDIFISLHDTIVSDRSLRGERSLVGRATALLDRLACRLATVVLADTPTHADFFADHARVARDRFDVLWVGARESVFTPRPDVSAEPGRVLFYGTYIPLHGIDTIVRAAGELRDTALTFVLIGDGQLRGDVDTLIADLDVANVEQVGLVPIEQLATEIGRAEMCLGIFGTSAKAGRVVPNKVFQCAAMARPIVTEDSPATREAFADAVAVVPPGDPQALADCLRTLAAEPDERARLAAAARARYERDYSQDRLAELLTATLDRAVRAR